MTRGDLFVVPSWEPFSARSQASSTDSGMRHPDVIVVGGGIGALSAACALVRKGLRVRVLERAKDFGDVGAGIQIAPNCTRILGEYGLLDEAKKLVAAYAALAARVLQRGAVARSESAPEGAVVDGSRIAVGTAHRDQAAAVRVALASGFGAADVVVDTANRLQGREFDVVIVLHPLSGRRDATAFHLEAGRLCVLTSRHRHACIVVARAGIPELPGAHPSVEPVHLGVPAKFPDGWEANQAMMAHLSRHRVPAG